MFIKKKVYTELVNENSRLENKVKAFEIRSRILRIRLMFLRERRERQTNFVRDASI